MQSLNQLRVIANKYDAVLLDVWGVVHDGTALYPGSREAMIALKASGKKVMLVSNAPRRSHKAVDVLEQLGVHTGLYDHIITSGELAYQWLASAESKVGKRYFYIGPSKDADVTHGLDYQRVDDVKQADFLLNVGFGSEGEVADDLTMLLRASKAQGLSMLCLNPDLEVVKISGGRFECAGVIARDYQRIGGEVMYFGKPYAMVYDYCLQTLLPVPKDRMLAVGDGILTDIAGAVNYGIDAVLVTGGIFKKDEQDIGKICAAHNAIPKYVMPQLAW